MNAYVDEDIPYPTSEKDKYFTCSEVLLRFICYILADHVYTV